MKKERLLFGIVFVVFFGMIGVVSANTCSSSDDIILKLYQETNSHSALWDDTEYTYDICYSDIFGTEYFGANPHDCDDNKILGLYDITNAHAEIPSLDNYDTDICYGDLSCVAREVCNEDEKLIVSLNQDTNSHVSDPYYLPNNAVSLWSFEENLIDSIGDNDGTPLDFIHFETGKIGKSLHLDVSTWDYKGATFDSLPEDIAGEDITITGWIYHTSTMIQGTIFSLEESNGIDKLRLHMIAGGGIAISSEDDPSSHCFAFLSENPISEQYVLRDTWNFYSIILSDSTDEIKIYVNGELMEIDSVVDSCFPLSQEPTLTTPSSIEADDNFTIGADIHEEYGGYDDEMESCYVDEFAVFNRVLSEEEILKMYHAGVYEKQICCLSGVSAGEVYWADMNGNQITTADIGDEVLMVFKDMKGENYNFEVWEKDITDEYITEIAEVFDYGNDLVAKFKITQTYWDIAKNWIEFGDPEFIFKVGGVTSPELSVPEIVNNTVPITEIIKPVSETNYVIADGASETGLIDFTQSSDDDDDDLKALWDFGDEQNSGWLENCLTEGNCNTTHIYSSGGTKNLVLKVEEMTRNQGAENSSRIYVYTEGINVFPIIDETVIKNIVTINIIRTHVADCTYTQVNCESASPSGVCDTITGEFGNIIYCYDKAIRIDSIDSNPNVYISWVFDGEPGTTDYQDPDNKYIFKKIFSTPGKHNINLKAGYDKLNP